MHIRIYYYESFIGVFLNNLNYFQIISHPDLAGWELKRFTRYRGGMFYWFQELSKNVTKINAGKLQPVRRIRKPKFFICNQIGLLQGFESGTKISQNKELKKVWLCHAQGKTPIKNGRTLYMVVWSILIFLSFGFGYETKIAGIGAQQNFHVMV